MPDSAGHGVKELPLQAGVALWHESCAPWIKRLRKPIMVLPSLTAPNRRLAPRCRGGASSLLRLTPTRSSKSCGWAETAAQALAPFLPTDYDASPLFTPLQPSPGVVHMFDA